MTGAGDADADWPCGLVVTDPDGTIRQVNETFLGWAGRGREELVGNCRMGDLLTAGGRILFQTHLNSLLILQGRVREVAVDLVAADGTLIPLLINVDLDRPPGGPERCRFAAFAAGERRTYERDLLEARRAAESAMAESARVQRRLSLMFNANAALTDGPDLAGALRTLADVLAAEPGSHCVILTSGDRTGRPPSLAATAVQDPARSGIGAALGRAVAALRPDSVLARALAAAGPTRVDLSEPDGWGGAAALGSERGLAPLGQGVAIPVRAPGRQVAAVLVARHAREAAYTEDDLQDLAAVAERIGLIVENRRLYEVEHNTAMALQNAMLTPAVELAGLEVLTRYLPSADGAMIGGDWYDTLVRPDGGAVLVVGDVMGHDHRAAASMGQLRGLIRTLAYSTLDRPAALLAHADRIAFGLAVDRLTTAVVAVVEPAGDTRLRLTWSNAGHPPPVLVRAAGDVRLLSTRPDSLLGFAPTARRHDHEVELEPGDTLLLYTDGLVENERRGLSEGLGLLEAVLAPLAAGPLDELADGLIARMTTRMRPDDLALLAVRVRH